jgi:hypothetical protein
VRAGFGSLSAHGLFNYRVCKPEASILPDSANAAFTTWRTSTRHQRPLGLFVAQLQLPAFDSAMIFSIMVDLPCWATSLAKSPAVYLWQ